MKDATAAPDGDEDLSQTAFEKRRAEHNKIRVQIRSAAYLTWGYLLMNGLAATIASYGLLSNSPAVVIGAMIVALLLGPIMGLALAITDGEWREMMRTTYALLMGGVVVYGVALLIGGLHAEAPMTAEITSRTRPNLFDLAIALAGGVAGAYATVSPRVSAGFVGVAIATALVPPLCASGLLLTRGEVEAAAGAALLAGTNIVAIMFASAVVLWVRGFARDEDGEKIEALAFLRRHVVGLAVLAGLAVFLAANLREQMGGRVYETRVRAILSDEMAKMPGNQLSSMEIFRDGPALVVRAEVQGPQQPTVAEVAGFAALIPPAPDGREVELRVRHIAAKIITPEGLRGDVIDAPLSGPPVGEP